MREKESSPPDTPQGVMHKFVQYTDNLRQLLSAIYQSGSTEKFRAEIEASLNGKASTELRRLIDITNRRSSGAFFTGLPLATRLIKTLPSTRLNNTIACDPTCGSGDLLLRWAANLPIEASLQATLLAWGHKLIGSDIHSEFIEATKLRLELMAISRFPATIRTPRSDLEYFPGLTVTSVLSPQWCAPKNCTILLNPPFHLAETPNECEWARGKVSSAALIFLHCVRHSHLGTHVTAILPDVLRTGSRYSKWRTEIEKRLMVHSIEIVGRFDRHTDVDVFLIHGQVEAQSLTPCSWTKHSRNNLPKVGALFDVHVGPLVAYREPKKGPFRPFLTATDLKHGATIATLKYKRRYSGPVIPSPFVAIQRTSSPTDTNRPMVSLVDTKGMVAVENHIITLRPKSGGKRACKQLIRVLQDKRTTDWLNLVIRCRHLTVSSIKDIPYWPRNRYPSSDSTTNIG